MNKEDNVNLSETTDNDKKKVIKISGEKFMEEFNKIIDTNEEYSSDDLKKLVVKAYKLVNKKSHVKREPSIYNKFMAEELKKLKADHPEKKQPELMKLAVKKWNDNKIKL
tara:strand:- start:4002 stop:4331 length:330 start_codon:yes stop_codon:yes gene_type:complete